MTKEDAIKRSEVLQEEIYTLVREINREGVDEVFFMDSPHVQTIDIRIYTAGWGKGKDPITLAGRYISQNSDLTVITALSRITSLRKIRMALKEILKGNYKLLYKAR